MNLKECLIRKTPYIIAEMSANHANDLETALKIVEAAHDSGADCLKTQIYTPDSLTIDCNSDDFKITSGLWNGYSLYELYSDAAMPLEWQSLICNKCKEIGIDYLGTAFDKTGVDILCDLESEAIKIASFEIVDLPLISYAASMGKTMIISCGMSSKDEIWDAVNTCLEAGNNDIILLKCSSAYPADESQLNLLTIKDMAMEFKLPVGYSDHSIGNIAGVTAIALGACVLEKHVCLDRTIPSADASFSMEPDEFRSYVRDIRTASKMMGNVAYGSSESEQDSLVFRRSIYAIKDIEKGDRFTKDNIGIIRPGYGIKPKYYNRLLGNVSARRVLRGEPIKEMDLGDG